MPSFITLADAKSYLSITGSDDDTLIAAFIEAASTRINLVAGRTFEATDHSERIDGLGEDRIRLREWPVIEVKSVATTFAEAVRVRYTGDGVAATVGVTLEGVALRVVDPTGASSTDTIDFADEPTIALLVDAINDEDDWGADALIVAPSNRLEPVSGLNALRGEVALAALTDDDADGYAVDMRLGVIGKRQSRMNNPYVWSPPMFDCPGGLRRGFQNVVVDYRAGYEVIPPDIQQLTREVVKSMWERRGLNTSLQSENLDQYSYTLANDADVHGKVYESLNARGDIR